VAQRGFAAKSLNRLLTRAAHRDVSNADAEPRA